VTAETAATVPSPPASISDSVFAAAEGTRATARWIATALGAVPSLAVLAAIVRAPGDAGFDGVKLGVGVGLAALGALVAILGFAWVIAPLSLEDTHLNDVNLKRIFGQPYTSIAELNESIEDVSAELSTADLRAIRASAKSQEAATRASEAEAEAKAAEEAASGDPGQLPAAARARAEADKAESEAASAARTAAYWTGELTLRTNQLNRRNEIRRDAYLLKAADEVSRRYKWSLLVVALAVAAIATGIVSLGLAPKPKAEAAPVTLVKLSPNEAGRLALSCSDATVLALKVGGTDAAPEVITLPTAACPPMRITFTIDDPAPLGKVEVVEPVEVP
jgi:hypothetical protein